MDIADMAAEREEEMRQDALAAARRTSAPGGGARRCEDCGEPIPAARRRALPGVTRCVDCSARNEFATTRHGVRR
ncbi:MAG: TraR/DksA family transcriptional regulator [Candidatus Accumulibacter sp.]|jgi:phage/conjugal plasmid C-4 type zinc finger TraR family protein|nr:TraR/DksA family transcriptional regulator [Accumulibacter sp.]